MGDPAKRRGELIQLLEKALAIAEELRHAAGHSLPDH